MSGHMGGLFRLCQFFQPRLYPLYFQIPVSYTHLDVYKRQTWTHLVVGQIYQLINKDGQRYFGVISSPATHGRSPEEKSKTLSQDELYLDLALEDGDFEKLNIGIGDEVVPYAPDIDLANDKFFLAKAIDNRISAYLGEEILANKLANKTDIYWAFTVQEEPGLRGARTVTDIVRPDLAFAIDTTLAGDTAVSYTHLDVYKRQGLHH